jgi:glycosyltransferase involved in cell wall biosynthesis
LYVGNRHNRFKNFEKFIRAFALLSEKNKDIRLVCTGAPFNQYEMSLFEKLRIFNRCCSIFASEMQMHQLYRDALFFVYPSLTEGFGMPILEAMQCGCPNVLAKASCFPEIAQNAAEYFDPQSIDNIYEVMDYVYQNESLRKKIRDKGFQRVQDFSWEKSAAQHYALYKSLI